MLIILHPYNLGNGIKAEYGLDLTVKFGSISVRLPVPSRPLLVGHDDAIFCPLYEFRSGMSSVVVHYHKTFPNPMIVDDKVIERDYRTIMTITIKRWGKSRRFYVRLDDELDSGIEIYKYHKGEEVPCSIERQGNTK